MLARVHGQFIDYRDLSYAIWAPFTKDYLEYHLEQSLAKMVGRLICSTTKVSARPRAASTRPTIIVKYIVDATVGPSATGATAHASNDKAKSSCYPDTRVLDPAMGSGHFLVEATEYIARFLVELNIVPEGLARKRPI